MMEYMTIGVAGGFGFLGSHVCRALQEGGYLAIPFSRRSGVDITDYPSIDKFLKSQRPDVVINCASVGGGIMANKNNPTRVYEGNLMLGYNITKASYNAGVKKLIHAIPNCVYPGKSTFFVEEEWQDGPTHDSVMVSGEPRRATWAMAQAYREQYGFPSVFFVLPNMYGPGDNMDPVKSHALGALIGKIVDAKERGLNEVTIWGTGAPIREWGYVEDIASLMVELMPIYDDGEILNVSCGQVCDINTLATLIATVVGWDGAFVHDTSKPDGAPKKTIDTSKLISILDRTPDYTLLESGIRKTVEWYLSQ